MIKKVINILLVILILLQTVSSVGVVSSAATSTNTSSSKAGIVNSENVILIKETTNTKKLTFISGDIATLTAKADIKGELKYQWYFAEKGAKTFQKATSKTPKYQVAMSSARSGRKVYCIVENQNGDRVRTKIITLNAVKKLKITQQPKNVTISEGEKLNISFKVSGEKDLTYKWYIKNQGKKEFSKSFVKEKQYSTISTKSSNGRKLYCVITDKYGQKVTTKTVTIKVTDSVKVSKKTETINKLSGKKAVVTAKTDLKGKLKYQWYFAEKGAKTFQKATCQTSKYQIIMNSARSGRRVYCIVKNADGDKIKTPTVTLNVVKKLKITQQPKDVTVSQGKTANISFKISGGKGLTYKWYIKNRGEKRFGLSSVKEKEYSTLSSKSSNGRKVYCVITDKYGQKVTTKTVTIKMGDVIKVSKKAKTINVISGRSAIVTVKTNLSGKLKYQWYFANRGSNEFKKASVKTATYKTVMNNDRDGRKVYCIVTDSKGKKVKSQVATLNTIKRLKITKQPTDVIVSEGKVAKVSFKVSAEKGLTYKWYIRNSYSKNFHLSSSKGASYSARIDDLANGRKVYCVVSDKYGQQLTTKTITIKMSEIVTVSKTTKTIMMHNSQTAVVTAKVSAKGKLKYQWYYAKPNSNKYYKSSVKTNTYEVVMNKARDGMKIYCVVTDKNGKKFTTQKAVINIIKTLKITEQPKNIMAPTGKEVTVSFKVSGEKKLEYQWYIRDKGTKTFKRIKNDDNKYSVKMSDTVDGRKIYCVITDDYGQKVTTDVVSFKKIKKLTVTKQPKGDLVMNGETITVETLATGEGELNYRWLYADAGEKDYKKTSIRDKKYELKMDENRNGRRVRCLITDNYGQEVMTNIVTLRSYKKLVITKQPKDATVLSGKIARATVEVSGESDLNYVWYISNKGSDKFFKSSDYDSEYAFTISKETDERRAYCVITDNHGQKVTTDTVTLKKDPNGLHVLIIGNSHSLDAFWYLRDVYLDQNPNSDICIGVLYSSSGSIAGHARVIKNEEATNRYYKNNDGKWACTYDVTHKQVLEDQEWDIILMQPGKTDITTNTVNRVSRIEVAEFVDKCVKNPHEFIWHVTWPCPNDETFFSPDYIRQPPAGYKDRLIRLYDFNPVKQYTEKVEKTLNVILEEKESIYSDHVSTGAAVMHALYNQNVSQLEMYRDYTHLSDYGRLLAAYSLYAQLFDKPIEEVGIDVITQESRFYLFAHTGDIVLTDKQKNVILKAANYSLENPWFIPEDK